VQFAPLATEAPHVLVCEKSPGLVPVNEIPEIVSVPVPVLNRVTPFAGLDVPTP